MKWHHYLILVSIGLFVYAVEQRMVVGQADMFIVLGSIPATIYLSTKTLLLATRNVI